MLLHRFFLLLAIGFLALACNRNPYKATNKSYRKQVKTLAKQLRQKPLPANTAEGWVGTVNFNLRKPNIVVIHHTAQNSCDQTLQTFTKVRTQVSAHYVICRDGKVQHMLNDYLRAWHAGSGSWGNITDVNSSSIGIELDNNGNEPFAPAQMDALLSLLQTLRSNYNIPPANFVGHCDVAPGRKTDPSVYFSWKQLADKGFGIWYHDTTGLKPPAQFQDLQALRIVGYSTRDSIAARKAFALHFMRDTTGLWTDQHRKVLYALVQQ
ncbi:N-acetylmuramoyl-L-alanine amidase, partial [Cnuella takakiae]